MNIAQIESNLQKLVKSFSKETFIYDLLLSYGLPKASITRLKKGSLNLSNNDGEIAWKKKLLFQVIKDADLHETIDGIRKDPKLVKHDPRFIVVTDFETILGIDTKTQDTLDIEIKDLPKHYDFFLPWAGMEKAQHQDENPADVKAAERMAKLFDEIKKDNPDESPEFVHGLNVFLSRLLFCFFAEDTNIFEENQFTNGISSHTQTDGSDLNTYMDELFDVLNTEKSKRKKLPAYLNAFPYVNGGLFRDAYHAPVFNKRSRKAIIDSGQLDWSAINPDIFGSMIQAVVTPEHRGGLGMHYTSVPNIMKVIEPLFLNELYEEFEKAKGNNKKLDELLGRVQRIKIFDPACGSGNFLIIAYKELRILEMNIFKERGEFASSGISLGQFYGIELDDFAHEIATLSLWLAEHQMNVEFLKKFGKTNPTLPLKDAGHITHGNATRLNWEEVCPKKKGDEIYILGNPPYLGFLQQKQSQKSDMDFVFQEKQNIKKLDYISCWFYLGAKYVNNSNSKLGFVSTNSLIQGEQVSLFWPYLLNDMNIEIGFAHQSFKWSNSAKSNAGITCVIIGLRSKCNSVKYLFKGNLQNEAQNINAYLSPTKNIFVTKRKKHLSAFPNISLGSAAYDGGYLMITPEERNAILEHNPNANSLFRKFVGSAEFVKGIERYCLWIDDRELSFACSIPEIKERLDKVQEFRKKSNRAKTFETAITPHRFTEDRHQETPSLLIPIVTSERREYLTLGFLSHGEVIPNAARAIYNAEPFMLGILSSKMHMCWVKAVAGKLEERIRYSAGVCYNSFPFLSISDQRKQEITQCAFRILDEREKHSEKTLAQLYDPDKMPDGLREAHHQNDLAIERCYCNKPFESDEERLEYLFKLYEKMIADEKAHDSLFAEQKKTRKRKK